MLAIVIIVLSVILDQLTKYFANIYLEPVESVPIIKNIVHLTYVENSGAAFSILQNQRLIFIPITIIIIIAVGYLLITKKIVKKTGIIAAALIIGGGIGNLIDRVFKGYVIDFIDLKVIHLAIFNVADSCVFIGAILGFIWYFFYDKRVVGELNGKENT